MVRRKTDDLVPSDPSSRNGASNKFDKEMQIVVPEQAVVSVSKLYAAPRSTHELDARNMTGGPRVTVRDPT